jgi:hypothetical protein
MTLPFHPLFSDVKTLIALLISGVIQSVTSLSTIPAETFYAAIDR